MTHPENPRTPTGPHGRAPEPPDGPQSAPQAPDGPEPARGATDAADGRTAALDAATPCTATNTRPWGNGPAINCTLPADHYDEDNEPTFNEDGSTITPGGWHHGLMDGLDLRWCDRAEGATPHTPAAGCGPECAEQHTYADGCEAQIDNGQTHNEPVVDEDAAPPAGALRDTIAEAVHATSVCEIGDPVRCGGGCRDAADAVLPVIEQHTARLRNRAAEAEAKAELTRGELVNTRRRADAAEDELHRARDLHADTERRLRADLAVEVRKREWAEAVADDERKAKQTAAGAADRLRDVLCEALGHDENPGDDQLVADLRARFGKTGPEPTRWRDFMAGAEAIRDQINAAHRDNRETS